MIDSLHVYILAAGFSRRMGDVNKLLLEINGESLIRRTAKLYRSAFTSVTVITGFENDQIEAALQGLDIKIKFNPDFATGQQSSVNCALKAANFKGDERGLIIALADQVALTKIDITDFAQAFLTSDKTKIYVPYYQNQRGNPVIFSKHIISQIIVADCHARVFIDKYPNYVEPHTVHSHGFVFDIDCPRDIEAFKALS